ncbi:hypothetical protein [Leifsonia sp. EB34]|uniref:hypothetical protein n=1 Tax=Leifsonia sp. EB34 TaxID=3156303 RepID=UPI003514828A
MTRGFQVDALGARLRVSLTGMPESDAERLREQWRRLACEGDVTGTVTVAADAGGGADAGADGGADVRADVTGRDLDEVGVALRRAINRRAIEANRGDLAMFHAAGLADPATGDVIALVGPSGAGKSTAAATLGRTLGYVSDETVAVTPSGEVLAFPLPLAHKRSETRGRHVVGPDELGLVRPGPKLRLARIALLVRSQEATTPMVETVGLREVLGDLAEQVNYFSSLPRPLSLLDGLVRRCGGVQVIGYREAADLVEPVRELLRGGTDPGRTDAGATYSRAEVDDWIDLGGEAVVHARGTITRLTPVSSLVWRLLEVPLTLPRLVAEAERAFGPAPDGGSADAIRAVLGELADAGLVRPARAARHLARD